MRYLLDTNLLSQQDTHPKVRNWIVQHYLQLAVSSVTVAEIAQGIEALPVSKRRRRLQTLLNEMLRDYPVLGFDTAEALEWGRYVNSVGRPVPLLDSLLAATALVNDLQVVTVNTKDFPGVSTINPGA
ncbi:MAG TPA: PIN domain-containing protein [Candidatus Binatia bacterium]|jgi:predicted nucleic acid-binding protein|nr:PIN domain-containing protein [Candidatus Binatia bacterium]